MAFDPRNLINIATHLSSLDDTEEAVRSTVNRAYYAAFGYAKIKTGETSFVDVHSKVINKLKLSTNPHHKKAGKSLETLRDSRNKADYHYNSTLRRVAYQNVINDANYIIGELEL